MKTIEDRGFKQFIKDKLAVNEWGDVLRYNKSKKAWLPVKPTASNVRPNGRLFGDDDNIYFSVGYSKDGKPSAVTVHRMVAECFVPKESEDCTIVVAIDGNMANFKASNLKWVEEGKVREHYASLRWRTSGLCTICGNDIPTRSGCKECNAMLKREENKLRNKQRRVKRREDTMGILDPQTLHEPFRTTLEYYYKGFTYKEIGERMGVSRQAIEQRLKSIEYRKNNIFIKE